MTFLIDSTCFVFYICISYADLVMHIDTVSIEIAPKFNYGRAIDTALCHVTALMTMYEALPSLDVISRSLGIEIWPW